MHGCLSYLISKHSVTLSKRCGISAERDRRLGKAPQGAWGPPSPPEKLGQRRIEAGWARLGPGHAWMEPADCVVCFGESSSPHTSYPPRARFCFRIRGVPCPCPAVELRENRLWEGGCGRGRASPCMWGAVCSALLRPQSRGRGDEHPEVPSPGERRRDSRGPSAGWGSRTPGGRKSGSVFSVLRLQS